jgi:hypothetical protein
MPPVNRSGTRVVASPALRREGAKISGVFSKRTKIRTHEGFVFFVAECLASDVLGVRQEIHGQTATNLTVASTAGRF